MKEKFSLNDFKDKHFKNVGKDKLLILIMAGTLLIVISLPTKSSNSDSSSTASNVTSNASSTNTTDYEEYLEKKIESLLVKVQGVGKVKVMVTLKASSEKVLVSEDTYSEKIVKATDSDGGISDSLEKSTAQAYLYSDNGSGGSQPYVSQEIKPEVEGVMVIAEGGSDTTVITNITNAIAALLAVPVHKIQVLKMSPGWVKDIFHP